MLIVDDREGSKQLMDYFPAGAAKLVRQHYGDVAFTGNGPDNRTVFIGVEVKTVSDALASIVSGRFAGHQLPGLMSCYDVIYLMIEGTYRPEAATGVLQIPRHGHWEDAGNGMGNNSKRWLYRDFEGWLTSLEITCGIRTRRTYNRQETAMCCVVLHDMWNKPFGEHSAHKVFNDAGRPSLIKPSVVRRVAAALPHVGWERAGMAEERFKTVQAMVLADEKDWMSIDGIGPKIAKDVVAAITGGKPQHECERHRAAPRDR